MIGDYFDALPIHPQPEPLESFTGYLTRLAEANKIQAVYQLTPLFFPQRARGVIREMADYPISSLDKLPLLAACSESRLLGTTFYYLVRRFNRSTRPQATGQFLAGVVARRFRYCPLCLAAETPYYSLAWRFQTLSGCPQHGCRLLDQCPHCRHDIPFLTTALKIGVCPDCSGGLSTGLAEPLVEAERQQVQHHYRDLAFLLAIPTDNAAAVAPGPRLAYWRRLKGMTVEEVAQQSGKTPRLIQSLEHYRLERHVKLQNYLDYVDCLGLSFAELFATEMSSKTERRTSFPFPEEGQSYEEQLVQRVEQSVATLKAEGTLLTQQAVSNHVGMSITGLGHYPQVKALLTRLNQERCQQLRELRKRREQKLVDEVQQAMIVLQEGGTPVTQGAIGDLVRMTVTALKQYPAVCTLLQKATQHQGLSGQKMLDKVEAVIVELYVFGQPITKAVVARLVGVTPAALNYHPQVRTLIEQNTPCQPRLPEENIDERIHEAVCTLRSQGQRLTLKSISKCAGITATRLRHYSQIEWLRECCREDKEWHKHQSEARLVVKVQQAIDDLQTGNKLVSKRAVCRLTGLSCIVFTKYPDLSKQVAVARCATRERRKEQRLQDILERVEQVLVEFKTKNIPFTMRDIYNQIGIADTTLRGYPEVELRMRQAVKEYRKNDRQQQRDQREQALVEQVQIAIGRLQEQGRPVTQKAICQVVGMARPTLQRYPRVRGMLDRIMQEGITGMT